MTDETKETATQTEKSANGKGTAVTKKRTPQAPPTPPTDQAAATTATEPASPDQMDETSLQELFEDMPTTDDKGPTTRPHAFVVMPFGKKKGFEGQILDFNAIYTDLIKPALEEAGFEAFRADEETVSGDILTDMFQELLLADLVIADMSIDNANVFYELGVRHAFRKRGVVHIQSGRAYMPFDIFNVRTIPYHTGADGVPDPEFLEKDRQAIARVCRDTYASDADAVHSPIFNLLTGLVEADRSTLRTPLATGFWREYNEWRERVTIAQRQKRIGDILVLTEEISNPLIKEEAVAEAGSALQSMGRDELALQQYRQGLEINARNAEFRRKEAYFLNRLGRVDEAIVKLETLLADNPHDTEAIAFLGRIYKDIWMESWINTPDDQQRLQEAFESYHWLLMSYHTYLRGYYRNLNDHYPAVNAYTLAMILVKLADVFDDKEDPDPEITAVRETLTTLEGALAFSLEASAQQQSGDYWTLVSLANLRVMTASRPRQVIRAYRRALTAARKNAFFLESELQQLNILKSLEMRETYVDAGMKILQAELQRIRKDEWSDDQSKTAATTAVRTFVFAGHMLDRPDRAIQRFPAHLEDQARQHIDEALDKLKADTNDRVYIGGAACGGDILFIERCLERGLHVNIYLPYSEPLYIKQFVSFGGDRWVERYYTLRNHPQVDIRFQIERLGKVKKGDNLYERNNRWALYSSLILGIDRVRMIALWDGNNSAQQDMDGLLVSHMVSQMRQMGGIIEHLNITKF
ncbi:MAG TPA: hypothetical protein PLD25_31895 [Chloroflexota bacterium]|nr:hypothetical protein [Chloroflexota bacterium]HUM69453.1 hypothetical protein [Chloroflexota bacterium]